MFMNYTCNQSNNFWNFLHICVIIIKIYEQFKVYKHLLFNGG